MLYVSASVCLIKKEKEKKKVKEIGDDMLLYLCNSFSSGVPF